MKKSEIQYKGMLEGVRVAFSAPSVAGPFGASLCADYGAEVTWIEPAFKPSIERGGKTGSLDADRKNMRTIALDIPTPDGKEVFLKMLKETDILIEASKGGQWKRWGLTDDVLWEANPKLIIIHVSGFGLSGDPDYVTRASYDPVAQAFGGMMYANSTPGQRPAPAQAIIVDYYTGLFVFGTALAAYIKMLKTGQGESIDIAQYEACVRCMQHAMADWNFPVGSKGAEFYRYDPSNRYYRTAGFNSYLCKDGNYIFALLYGPENLKKLSKVLGFEYGSEEFPANPVYFLGEPHGDRYEELVQQYFLQHDAKEAEAELAALGCPVMCSLTFDQMLDHPHYLARETITTVDSLTLEREIKIPNIFPKVKNNPTEIWRPAPRWGEDTNDILEELGYSAEEIAKLIENKTVRQL